MDQNQRWRSPHQGHGSPNSWQSPRFRGSPGHSPNMGRYQSPRHQNFRPFYNDYGQSPQHYHSPYNRPRGSFPRHSSPKFFQDRSFSSPHAKEGRQGQFSRDDIENWVSPEMWGDPWAELRSDSSQIIGMPLTDATLILPPEPNPGNADRTSSPRNDDVLTDRSFTLKDGAEIPLDDDDDGT